MILVILEIKVILNLMFKKIEIWILYLVILFGIPVTIGFSSIVRHELLGGKRLGNISKAALFLAEIPSNIKNISKNKNVHLLEDRFPLLDGFNGTPNSSESYLLLTRYDGNLKQGVVDLVDLMSFSVLHTWNPNIDKFNEPIENYEKFKFIKRDRNDSRNLLRHPLLLEDGSLVFHHLTPLRKIDSCSKLIFQNTLDKSHHSIETDIEGNIWGPSFIYPQTLPKEIVGRKHILEDGSKEDGLLKISPAGKILFRRSLSQIFLDNNLENYLFGYGHLYTRDPLHLNDIQPVNFDGDYWRKGDLFLSLRNQSMIVLYRPSNNKIVWKIQGPFFNQHDVDILDDHRISIFNNRMQKLHDNKLRVDGNNEVIIYNFKNGQFSSYLEDSLIKNDVRTKNQGLNQILSNGDLFVEETNYGRTLYFDSDGSLRWTHVNKADDGKVYSIGWSRILYTSEDISNVKNFLNNKSKCNG